MGSNVILAVGAIIIFGTFLSSSNNLMTGNTQIAEQNEYYITALSLAQSIIDEAKAKAFDQKTVAVDSVSMMKLIMTPPTLDSMTAANALGKDAGESVPNPDTLTTASPFSASMPGFLSSSRLNDVDDYANYSRLVNTPRAEGYKLRVQVNYASETYPDSMQAVKTFCKTMTVFVTSRFLPSRRLPNGTTVQDTVKLSYAFTY